MKQIILKNMFVISVLFVHKQILCSKLHISYKQLKFSHYLILSEIPKLFYSFFKTQMSLISTPRCQRF